MCYRQRRLKNIPENDLHSWVCFHVTIKNKIRLPPKLLCFCVTDELPRFFKNTVHRGKYYRRLSSPLRLAPSSKALPKSTLVFAILVVRYFPNEYALFFSLFFQPES